jgi:hypothetical protein
VQGGLIPCAPPCEASGPYQPCEELKMTKLQGTLFDDLPAYVGPVSKHPVYRVWSGMMSRCHNPKFRDFKHYGGRGIFVCDEWRASSRAFVAWAIKAGWQAVLQIDREDNDGPYSPGNCRFVSRRVNMNNRRSTRRLPDGMALADAIRCSGLWSGTVRKRIFSGVSVCDAVSRSLVDQTRYFLSDGTPLMVAARAAGLSKSTVKARLRRGWSPDDAVSIPVGGKRPAATVAIAQGESVATTLGDEGPRPAIPRGLVDLPAVDLPWPVYGPGYPKGWLAKGNGDA